MSPSTFTTYATSLIRHDLSKDIHHHLPKQPSEFAGLMFSSASSDSHSTQCQAAAARRLVHESACICTRVQESSPCPQVLCPLGLVNTLSVPASVRFARSWGSGASGLSMTVVSWSTRCVYFVRPLRPKFLTCMTCIAEWAMVRRHEGV